MKKRINLIIWTAAIILLLAINLGFLLGNNLIFYAGLLIAAIGFITYAVIKIVDAMGINLFATVILGLAIVGVLNYGFAKFHKRIDLTKEKVYSLSPQTVKILKNLKDKVNVIGFAEERSDARNKMENLLEQYRDINSSKFSYKIIDPYKSPEVIAKYGNIHLNTVLVEVGKRKTKVEDLTEENLTNAIIKLTKEAGQKIFFIKGHGEGSIEDFGKNGLSKVAEDLRNLGYEVREISLVEGDVPETAKIIVIPGPKTDYTDIEITRIDKFLRSGGSVIFMIDPLQKPLEKIPSYLKKFGVELKNTVVVDMFGQILGANVLVPVATSYKYHEITKDFKLMTFYPLAQGVFLANPLPKGVTGTEIVESSPKSWAKTKLGGKADFDPATDIRGPISLAVALEVEGKQKGRIVVFGDSDFIKNAYFDQQGNGNLFENAVNWCAKEENLIAIKPRTFKPTTLVLTANQQRLLGFISLILIPEIFLILGILVWVRRRWL
ncbi:MAG: Gldg family protein [Candidatus Aminicenantes bacterium]|nr:Gldg family protein [Candidatus Aminicenantes bacterium]